MHGKYANERDCCPLILIKGVNTTTGQAGYCEACNKYMPSGPDLCLGILDNVAQACCGHGDPPSAYVVIGGLPDESILTIDNPITLRGEEAIEYFARVKGT